jgi:hypothetical protein
MCVSVCEPHTKRVRTSFECEMTRTRGHTHITHTQKRTANAEHTYDQENRRALNRKQKARQSMNAILDVIDGMFIAVMWNTSTNAGRESET